MSLQTFFDNFALLMYAPNSITKLRELILRLAVRGNLVPQNPNEEPASALVARGLKSKQSSATSLPNINGPHKIPSSWKWVRFEDIVDFDMGKTPSTKASAYWDNENDGIAWVSIADMPVAGTINVTAKRVSKKAVSDVFKRAPVSAETLLMSFKLSIGKVAFLDVEAYHNEAIISIFPFIPEIKYYLFYCLRGINLLADSNNAIKGATLNSTSLKAILIPLPPLEEQKRIIAKVDELMRLCDEMEARQQAGRESRVRLNNATLAPLNNAATLAPGEFEQSAARLADNFTALYDSAETVGRLRATILQLAVQGKLVPQNPNDKPVGEYTKDSVKRGVKSISADEVPFNIPNTWQWFRLGCLAELINGDRGKNYPNKNEYVQSGLPFINTGHIRPGGTLSLETMHYITRKKFDSLRSGKIRKGDLVYCLRGATLGKTAIVNYFDEGAVASSLVIIRLEAELNNKYTYFYLTSPIGKELIKRFDNGSAQPNLSANSVKQYVIPVPPLEEQKRIVAKVNQLMVLCDELETKLRQTEANSEKLMKAAVCDLLASVAGIEKSQCENAAALSSV